MESAVDVFAPMKLAALPVYDYLNHFTEMRSFVVSTCASVLTVGAIGISEFRVMAQSGHRDVRAA